MDTSSSYIMGYNPSGHQRYNDICYLTFSTTRRPLQPITAVTYFGVVFLLGPFMIATGAAMSPAITAQFPEISKDL